MPDVPAVIITSLDPVLRDTASSALLCDLPGAVVVRHDITPEGMLHRAVFDWSGVRDRRSLLVEHGCLSCALRADLLSVLRDLMNSRIGPESVVVVLPVATEARTLVHALQPEPGGGSVPGLVAAGVLTAVEPIQLVSDLFGDDLLAERGLQVDASDRRSVGEVLAAQIEYADLVLTHLPPGALETTVLAHLRGPRAPIVRPNEMDAEAILRFRRRNDDPRGDILQVRPAGAADTDLVWTVDLRSPRPFHPGRLHDEITALGSGALRSRGAFWLPTRPHQVGIWDGAGCQLSIGTAGSWPDPARRTQLVITGLGSGRDRVQAAYARALTSQHELSGGLDSWAGLDDGFDAWMGESAWHVRTV